MGLADMLGGLAGGAQGAAPGAYTGQGVNSGFTGIYGGSGYAPAYGGSNVPYGQYGQLSNQFGVSQGGYGAYMTDQYGNRTGIGANTSPTVAEGAGGVFTVNRQTGAISRVPALNTSYGAPGSGLNNPLYGMGMGPTSYQTGGVATAGQLGAGNNQRMGATSNTGYQIKQDAGGQYMENVVMGGQVIPKMYIGNNMTGLGGVTTSSWNGQGIGVGGQAGAGGAGGANSGLEGLAAMGQRRLAEQSAEQNEQLANQYQSRGLSQSGLWGEAQARQTRDQGYALADFLAQLYGRGMTQQSSDQNALGALSASRRDSNYDQGPSNYDDLAGAYMNMLMGQQISPDIENMLRALMGARGGGGGYTDYSGLYTDPLVAQMTAARNAAAASGNGGMAPPQENPYGYGFQGTD